MARDLRNAHAGDDPGGAYRTGSYSHLDRIRARLYEVFNRLSRCHIACDYIHLWIFRLYHLHRL
jgi:hypothetical protein